ncbi:MAG TPA: hypothetical protein PK417_02765 [Hyphomonas sp.]|nr:hypothetical protein [Hyphomonas sp.]HRX72703.1 hypothetical protein [Hyphomonas sp.]
MLALLLAARRRGAVRLGYVEILSFSLGVLPFLIFVLKDVTGILTRATLGPVGALKYSFLVLGLPTCILFVVAALALAFRRALAPQDATYRGWKIVSLTLLFVLLQVFQSLWLFQADASL